MRRGGYTRWLVSPLIFPSASDEESLARAARQRALLVDLSARIVAQRSVDELLATVVDAARELTESRLSVSGHGYKAASFALAWSRRPRGRLLPARRNLQGREGWSLLGGASWWPIATTRETELRNHHAWWGLPEGHGPASRASGHRLVDAQNNPCGLIMASDKETGGDSTEDDEAGCVDLPSITSLALGHIEARIAAEAAAEAKSSSWPI